MGGLGETFTVGVTVTVVVMVTAPEDVISALKNNNLEQFRLTTITVIIMTLAVSAYKINYQLIVLIINSIFKYIFWGNLKIAS